MKYMCDEGYTVVGIEYSRQPVEEFFKENNIKFAKSKNGDYDAYKSDDGKITIYAGDFFQAKPELVGKIDGIWDRGALVAMNPSDMRKYAETILNLMNKDTVYFIAATSYDQSGFGGPPFSVPMETVEELYGSTFKIEKIYEDTKETYKKWYKLEWFLYSLYFLKFKN